jgi:hypothetical protein
MKIKNLSEKLITLGIVAVIVLVMYLLDIRCFFKLLFNISCPGCGMTRAWVSVLRLDIAEAFRLNPMFWSVPILCALYLFDGKIFKHRWLNYAVTIGILAGFFACWIVRLVMGWQV